jgi:hypothetical protein
VLRVQAIVPLPSLATLPGAVAKATSEPIGASSCDSPPPPEREARAKGLSRQASRMTTLMRFLAVSILSSTCCTSTAL